jgi:hypothetical protein
MGVRSAAVGMGSEATGDYSIAIGFPVEATEPYEVKIGDQNSKVQIDGKINGITIETIANGVKFSDGEHEPIIIPWGFNGQSS